MLEKYQKEVDKIENPKNENPEWEPTLKDVLKDKEKSALFGEFLKEEESDNALAERVAKGELKEEDIVSLDKHRKTFLTRMEDVNTVKESIDEDTINAFAKNDPDFKKIVSLIGPEAYKELVKEKLAKFSITDATEFASLAKSVKKQNEYRSGEYKELDEEITELCKKKGIKADDYMAALAIEDPAERNKAVREAVRTGYGSFAKAGDWLSAGAWSKKRVDLMESKREDIDDAMAVLKKHQRKIGGFLAGMTEHDEIRSAVSKELIGEKAEKVPTEGFMEAKSQMPTVEKLQKDWAAAKATIKTKGGWDALTPGKQSEFRDEFITKQEEAGQKAQKNKSGLWGLLFGVLSPSFFTNNKNTLN